jgi:hypothetical protein
VRGIDQEHTRAHHVTKRRGGLAERFVDDLQAASSLHTDVGVYVAAGQIAAVAETKTRRSWRTARLKPIVRSSVASLS